MILAQVSLPSFFSMMTRSDFIDASDQERLLY